MVSLDDLANEITSAVKAYTEDVTRGIEKELDKTSKQLTKEISVNSPKSKGKNSGRYATGWTRKKMNEDGAVKYIIHNKKRGSFAHLLEFGHAKRGGGRVPGKPHILPAYDHAEPELVSRIKSIVRNGG